MYSSHGTSSAHEVVPQRLVAACNERKIQFVLSLIAKRDIFNVLSGKRDVRDTTDTLNSDEPTPVTGRNYEIYRPGLVPLGIPVEKYDFSTFTCVCVLISPLASRYFTPPFPLPHFASRPSPVISQSPRRSHPGRPSVPGPTSPPFI